MSFTDKYKDAIESGNKRDLLDLLNNSFEFDSPDGNLQVAFLDQKTGKATHWMSWWYVREHPFWCEKVNNRLIGISELAFDMDRPATRESAP